MTYASGSTSVLSFERDSAPADDADATDTVARSAAMRRGDMHPPWYLRRCIATPRNASYVASVQDNLATLAWDDVRVFLAVARTGRLAAAAARLGLDVSTVSRRVDRLEDAL